MKLLDWDSETALPTGGDLRWQGPDDAATTVLLVGGGTSAHQPGRWSTSMTWLAPRLRAALPDDVRIAQVRYESTAFNRIERSIADVGAALDHEQARPVPPRRVVLVGLSMGGATCIANVDREEVVGLVAIAPWFPKEIPIEPIGARRLLVVHGTLDNALPLVPGTSLAVSRRAVERARAVGADADWVGIPRGLHGLAVKVRGKIRTMPRARAFTRVLIPEVVRLSEG